MIEALALYLIAINATAFAALALDKAAARRRGRRAPEQRLLVLAVLGGSAGALAAQQALRHKTRKEPFRRQLWSIALLQALALAALAYRLAR